MYVYKDGPNQNGFLFHGVNPRNVFPPEVYWISYPTIKRLVCPVQITEGQDILENLTMIFVVGKNHEVEDALYILMVVV